MKDEKREQEVTKGVLYPLGRRSDVIVTYELHKSRRLRSDRERRIH